MVASVLPVARRRSPVAGSRRIPACQFRRRGRERNRPLAALTPAVQDLFPGRGRPGAGCAGAVLSLPAEKHLAQPGPAGCPPALLRLRAFRRRNTPNQTPPPGTTHPRRSTPWTSPPPPQPPSPAPSRVAVPDHPGRGHLHRRLRAGLPGLRRTAPRVVERRPRSSVLIPSRRAHRADRRPVSMLRALGDLWVPAVSPGHTRHSRPGYLADCGAVGVWRHEPALAGYPADQPFVGQQVDGLGCGGSGDAVGLTQRAHRWDGSPRLDPPRRDLVTQDARYLLVDGLVPFPVYDHGRTLADQYAASADRCTPWCYHIHRVDVGRTP